MPANLDSIGDWQRVEQLFHAALSEPADQRGAFLARACGSDLDLLREVESLLSAHVAGDELLERPAIAHIGLLDATVKPPAPWTPGMTFGHYRITEPLGGGGMGEVFRARDLLLDREVALKTLPPDLSVDRSYLERLRREARLLATVNHPNVATLHEVEEVDGRIALVMELVEGETLASRLSRGRLAVSETLALATQILAALEAAHRKGLVHRDLKPGNIMIARGGLLKVVDFGLAVRGPAGSGGSRGERRTTALSSPGAVLGTTGYMSPEQVQGQGVDCRSDIFSFGAVLYEMVSGTRAFRGDTAAEGLASVLRDDPPPLGPASAEFPKRLLRVIQLCLRKNPDERYQSVTDVRLVLDELKEDLDDQAPAASPRVTRRGVVFGAAVAAGGAALSYIGLRISHDSRPPILATPLTMYYGHAQSPALSPDGKMVAFMWDGEHQDNFDIYVKVIGSGEPLRLTSNPRPEVTPLWSPDGRFIAFSRTPAGPATGGRETIYTIPVLGGPERIVGPGFANDWSPDGTLILALVATEGEAASWRLVTVADGSSRRLIVTPPGSTLGRGRFSPDGRKVFYVEQTAPAESHLNEIEVAGTEPKRIPIAGLRSIDTFAWVGANDLILGGRTFQSAVPRFYRVPASGGVPDPLSFGANGSGVHTFPGAGALVYSWDELSENIWRVGAWPGGDRQPRRWITGDGPMMNPAVSPVSDRIAFASRRTGNWTIWTSDADGNAAAPAVRFPSGATRMIGSPAWSPDGNQIAFDVRIGNYPNIFVAVVGSGSPQQITEGNGQNLVPAWSPDGRWIYYTSRATGAETIWRIPAGGGEPRQITKHGGYSVKVSPDGKYLYYLKSSREGGLRRAAAEGGEEELLVPDLRNRNFQVLPDGVYLLDSGVSEMSPLKRGRARFYRFRTRKVEDLGFQTEKPIDHYGISLSSDGKWLYYVQVDRNSSNVMLVENFR
jgi:eukaryotic-like serine/threonine-protein kinase